MKNPGASKAQSSFLEDIETRSRKPELFTVSMFNSPWFDRSASNSPSCASSLQRILRASSAAVVWQLVDHHRPTDDPVRARQLNDAVLKGDGSH